MSSAGGSLIQVWGTKQTDRHVFPCIMYLGSGSPFCQQQKVGPYAKKKKKMLMLIAPRSHHISIPLIK